MNYEPYQAGEFIANSTNATGKKHSSHYAFSSPDANPFETETSSSSALESSSRRDSDAVLRSLGDLKPSPLVIILTFLASISGFMFGYDTGYISSALVVIGDDLGQSLSYGNKEFITSATSLGALVSSVAAGILADCFGRKYVIIGSNVLFVTGAIMQCVSHSLWLMIAGRFVMGFGVGIGSLIAPLYISELAPNKYRGRLVVINVLAITGGQLVAYGIGAGIANVHNGWRLLVGLSLIPSIMQLVMFTFMPDTPRYLIMKNKLEEASKVLQRVYKGAEPLAIDQKVQELYEVNSEISGSSVLNRTWNSVKELHTKPSNFRALVIGCGLQGIQQFTGWNALMYFSATIFETIGFNNSTAVSIIIAGTNFIFTAVAFFVIDRVGRRRILLIGLPLMIISLVLCSIAFHFAGIKFEGGSAVMESQSGGVSAWGIVIIVGMILFASGYAVGIGNVPWQQSELFPQRVRGVGASYATATNWAGSLVISSTFLTMLENITPTGTFALFAALAFLSLLFVYFCYPELTGLELEEVQSILTGGFNIDMSLKLSKSRRAPGTDKSTTFGYRDDHVSTVSSSDASDSKASARVV